MDQPATVDTIVASISQRATRNVNLVEHLNQGHFFLRGGLLSEQGQAESFALQDHSHEDEGHTHADQGHGHDDLGHMHDLDLEDDLGHKITYDVLRPGDAWGDGDGGPKFGESFDMEGKAGTGHANIQVTTLINMSLKCLNDNTFLRSPMLKFSPPRKSLVLLQEPM